MYIIVCFQILILFAQSLECEHSSPFSGDFSPFGPCTLKFIRKDANLYYKDLNELLIKLNQPSLATVNQGFSNLTDFEELIPVFALEFRFFEHCSITIALDIQSKEDWGRVRYLSRDHYRSSKFQNFIIFKKEIPTFTNR